MRITDMSAATDYARAVEQFSKAQLTPYVSYAANVNVDGLGKEDKRNIIVVRVSDGKIVSGKTPNISVSDSHMNDDRNLDPVEHPLFNAACYRATGESPASFENEPALKIDLAATCSESKPSDHNYPFTALYVDPRTLAPLDAVGVVPQDSGSKDVSVSMEQRFARFGERSMPTSMKVDVSGSGLMFWLQVHLDEEFSDYQFLNAPPR